MTRESDVTLSFDVLLVGDAPAAGDVRAALPEPLVEPTAVSGMAAALSRVAEGGIDCVVTDHDLPDGDAIELLEQLGERTDRPPGIVYTAAGDEAVASAAIDAGAAAYIPRTGDDTERLAERVVEEARRNHVAATMDTDDPMAADLQLSKRTLDEAPVGVVVADPHEEDEPLVYINEAFERLTGYERHEVLGRNCRFLQGEDTNPEAVATIRQAVDDRRPVSVELLNYRKDGEPFWNQLNIAPIRDDDGRVTHLVGFQTDITERKEVELRAQRQAEQLRADRRKRQRLLARIDGLVRRVTEATVESTDATALRQRVCQAVVDTGDYDAAWIGSKEATSGRLVADCRAGCGAADAVAVDLAQEGPAATALDSGGVAVAEATSLESTSVHRRFVGPNGAVAAVPLQYREANYGVLVVYAAESQTVDEHEQAVLEALGRVAATGLNALQNHRLLTTDERLELAFAGEPPGPGLAELAAEAEADITYRGIIANDGELVVSALIGDSDAEALSAAADSVDGVEQVREIASHDDGCLVEALLCDDSLVRLVLDHNGAVQAYTANSDRLELRVELPPDAAPNPLVESLQERCSGLSLRSQRHTQTDAHGDGLIGSLRESLTDRQLETLRRAYLSDYFEWPRPVSGDDIAESMDISRSTLHQHLRAAESKLVGALLTELDDVGDQDRGPN
ncbi:receiver/sensor/bat box HTH-10 family transcription regulator Bat (homolog to bacterioopsin activator) [Natronomonas pharaonis DSM 2160]|uniref:Receiver/sensor/bat box HTH-10 family transcription regulator Bat (Homolog to bacterioopsin activator) n=1 Tax=Natronomonas pharaonis (strain ATCC 35678 / DSM 2160 / CIP 103997 / JCM 8858 / NBRC 14720 / NCIMB 2260 / Gabara) TaxID=348780 RepID=A0A1U7ETZ5_NATPD|nr:bacterio-opsin activator domain-containing protein [Natronomonas pharaonis]CAI48418.1 receiver/sensor/bat box HTH-10 family transcription regulator Bat (homolog to bacterioopsin activator) [Natronomonas pharaonis DSM 2160]